MTGRIAAAAGTAAVQALDTASTAVLTVAWSAARFVGDGAYRLIAAAVSGAAITNAADDFTTGVLDGATKAVNWCADTIARLLERARCRPQDPPQ